MGLFPQNDPAAMQLTALPEGLPLQPAGLLQPSGAGALAAGIALGHLGQLSGQLALEKAQRRAEMADTEYRLKAVEHLQTNLPLAAAAQAAAAQAATATSLQAAANAPAVGAADAAAAAASAATAGTTLALETATRGARVAAAAQTASNTLAGAQAAAPFAARSPLQQLQDTEAAKALGGMGLPATQAGGGITAPSLFLRDASGKVIPPGFTDSSTREEVDPDTLDVHNVQVITNKFTGDVIKKVDLGVIKPGTVQRPVTQSIPEATAIVQTMAMADKLAASLDNYIAGGNGGILQAIATNQANKAPTGTFSVIGKAVGADFQSPATIAVAGEIQNLKNTLANAMFGTALSKEESQNLQGMLPTPEDLADPARAREKLKTTRQFLEEKLKPYADRGVLKAAKLETPAAPASAAAAAPAAIPDGTERMINGVASRRITVNGRSGWVPIAK